MTWPSSSLLSSAAQWQLPSRRPVSRSAARSPRRARQLGAAHPTTAARKSRVGSKRCRHPRRGALVTFVAVTADHVAAAPATAELPDSSADSVAAAASTRSTLRQVALIRERRAVAATSLLELGARPSEHALAAATKDALPAACQKGDVDEPRPVFVRGPREADPLAGILRCGHRRESFTGAKRPGRAGPRNRLGAAEPGFAEMRAFATGTPGGDRRSSARPGSTRPRGGKDQGLDCVVGLRAGVSLSTASPLLSARPTNSSCS